MMTAPLDDDAPLDTVVASGPGLLCLLDRDGQFRAVSPDMCALLGGNVAGQAWSDHVEDVASVAGAGLRFVGRIHAADGGWHWLRWSVSGLASGGQLWVMEDITDARYARPVSPPAQQNVRR